MSQQTNSQSMPSAGLGIPVQLKVLEYLVSLVNDPATSVVGLEAVIGWDPSLTRSVILKANATFGLAVHSRDLNLSLALLGSGMVKETVKLSLACAAARRMINSLYQDGAIEEQDVSYALVTRALAVEVHCCSRDEWWDPHEEAAVKSGLYSGVIKDELADAFEELSDDERFLLTLHYYEGLSLKIVEGMLGLPEGSGQALHDRALEHLREASRPVGT
jgi:DNA-directed RNA polymerase specialized sigma24 family protein